MARHSEGGHIYNHLLLDSIPLGFSRDMHFSINTSKKNVYLLQDGRLEENGHRDTVL